MAGHKIRKAVDPHVLLLDVVGSARISPNVVCVTLGGEAVRPGAGQVTIAHEQGFGCYFPVS